MNGEVVLFYRLDSSNRILEVHPDWDRVALNNEGDKVVSSLVIGKPIWEFITGDSTRLYLDAIIQNCRATQKVIVKPYRCDRPNLKRFMEMIVTPLVEGEVLVEHVEVNTESIVKPLKFTTGGTGTGYKRCSVCNRLKFGNHWIEPNEMKQSNPMQRLTSLKVKYSVCPSCLKY